MSRPVDSQTKEIRRRYAAASFVDVRTPQALPTACHLFADKSWEPVAAQYACCGMTGRETYQECLGEPIGRLLPVCVSSESVRRCKALGACNRVARIVPAIMCSESSDSRYVQVVLKSANLGIPWCLVLNGKSKHRFSVYCSWGKYFTQDETIIEDRRDRA